MRNKRVPRFLRWPVFAASMLIGAASTAGIQYKPPAIPETPEKAAAAAVAPPVLEEASVAEEAPVTSRAPRMRSLISSDISQLRWERSLGGERTDRFNDVVVRRSDLAVIAVGSSLSRSAGRKDAWAVAMDAEGTPLWETNLGGALDEAFNAVVDLDNGALVAVGYESTGTLGGGAGIAIGLSEDGEEIWRYRYDSERSDQFSAVAALDTGDLLVAGAIDNNRAVLARISTSGEAIWERSYEQDMPQRISAILPLANGDILVVGESTQLFDSDAAISRLSSSGELLWHETAGDHGNDRLHDVLLLPSGKLIAAGESERNGSMEGWLVSWSTDGELLWEKTVGGPGRDALHTVAQRANFSLIAAGSQDADNRDKANAWLVEFTEDGAIAQAHGFGGEFGEAFAAISPRSDGSIVAAGYRQPFQDAAFSGYAATIGAPIQRLVMRGGNERLNPPVVFVPGEGKLLTDNASVEVLGNVIHNRPINQLFVDGLPARLLHNGAFTARVSIPMGTTRVKVEAIDSMGVTGAADIMVTRVEAGTVGTSSLAALKDRVNFGNYHAVVIGNNAYSRGLPALETAEQDATAVAETLEREFGFQVDLLINADRDAIVSTIEGKSSSLRDDDNLLIYYAGHGYYDEDVDLGYWLPVDAALESKDNWIRNSTITDSIKSMKAKHVMLVADSCFSGTLLRSVDVRRNGKFYEEMASRTARLVMTSGGVEPVMDGGGDGHSVFARNFLNKLRSGEAIIDGTSLYQSIREPVVLSSQQVPQYANIRFIQSDGGDFLFVRKDS